MPKDSVPQLQAPHQHIQFQSDQEKFLIELFDTLWTRYRGKMQYVQKYEAMVQSHGAKFINDHIAFRTIASQKPLCGIFMISRIFEALGYHQGAAYEFPDKSLSSIHYKHPNPQFPKLFVTQLKTWELSEKANKIIDKSLKSHRPVLTDETLHQLNHLSTVTPAVRAELLKKMVDYFSEVPWELPQKKDVEELDKETQFGAWVLINGYDVNHFTASVDSHQVKTLDDIEKVAQAMRDAGVPMKKDIEGERGSKLRQTATESAVIQVPVKDGERTVKIPWTYAYFEIAQRPLLKNPATGKTERFEGFLGGQATNLFDMTKLKK